jgi:hypothetical protein
MAFSLVQNTPVTMGFSGASPIHIAYASNNGAGNLLLAFVTWPSGNTLTGVTDSNGNSWLQIGTSQIDAGTESSALFYVKSCNAGANNVAFAFTGAGSSGMNIYEFSGNSSNPLDTSNGSVGATSTVSAGPITPAGAGELIILVAMRSGGGTTYTPGSGFTLANPAGAGQFAELQYNLSGPAGSQTPTMTMTTAGNNVAFAAAFLAPAAPPPSGVYSVPDCRVAPFGPNANRTVNATKIYDVQTSSNSIIPPTDSRAAGQAPVDSRAAGQAPQNSRTPGTFGPGVN